MRDQSALVINTGPLIAIVAAVGDLTVLKHLYRRVLVPHEVCLEILAAGDDGFAAPQFSAASWLERLESPRHINQYLINSLDRGEASVIQSALDLGIDTVCIDEAVRWTPPSRQKRGEFKIIAGRAAARRCPESPRVSA
jgi:predicted nucleic acid-binding protein